MFLPDTRDAQVEALLLDLTCPPEPCPGPIFQCGEADLRALLTRLLTPASEANYYGQPLAVSVKDGRLTIEIGIHTLAHAVAFSNWANPYDQKRRDYIRTFAITNPDQFARDVLHEMQVEREDGSTPLSDFIDKVSEEAINQGSEGIHEDEQVIAHGQFSLLETWSLASPPRSPGEPT